MAESAGRSLGATFVVRLPLHHAELVDSRQPMPAPTATSLPSATLAADLCGLTVLAVDDQPDVGELVSRVLQECGARVTCASDAGAALRLFEAERPDVVVSDISMPGTDGYELARRLRALDAARGSRTPLVAMTAFARAEDRQRALDAGFDLHVAKPVHPVDLAAAVARAARRAPHS